jgi:hypothetical protein
LEQNWITTTIERMSEERRRFMWDACVTLTINEISGDYVEFGSWGADSLGSAHAVIEQIGRPRHLWAFDSFSSMPAAVDERDARWAAPAFGRGGQGGVDAFHEQCAAQGIPRGAYTAVEGYFEDVLPPLGSSGDPSDIALAYIDCNMYSSTVSVLAFLEPRLKHGMILAFDDYHLWTSTQVSGERSAFDEFTDDHPEWSFLRYRDVHYAGVSFVVERAELLRGR